MSSKGPVTIKDIRAARERVADHVHHTPLEVFEYASEATGNSVWVKLENMQRTGSFKERGALNKLLSLSKKQAGAGVVAASAGNHAQGVAWHAQRLGIAATIVMPVGTPLVKVSACKEYGADVILHGANYDAAYAEALRLRDERSLTLIHPFDDPLIIAGQGTVALEILEKIPDLDAIVVPVGGGGLISGIAVAVKAIAPKVRVYGVEPAHTASMEAALSAGHVVEIVGERTLADGLSARRVGEIPFELVRQFVDGIATVEESEIATAILHFMERGKTVVEGAGAVGLAALDNRRLALSGKRVVLLVSGGNIDVNILSRIIERGLVKVGRMVRLNVHISDEPGALARLTALVAEARANVVEIHHIRAFGSGDVGDTDVELTLETRGFDHIESLLAELQSQGYRVAGHASARR